MDASLDPTERGDGTPATPAQGSGVEVPQFPVGAPVACDGEPFKVRAQLGGGSFGWTYEVNDSHGRIFVLKVMKHVFVGEDKKRLIGELGAQQRLAACAGVPRLRTFGDVAQGNVRGFGMLTDLIGPDARTLDALLEESREGRKGPDRALVCLRQVGETLVQAHEAGVIHRDLSPRNILVSPDGRAFLIDFGLATHVGCRDPGQRTGGTKDFRAPELDPRKQKDLRGKEREIGPAADQYSLANLMLFAVTGQTVSDLAGRPLRFVLEKTQHPGLVVVLGRALEFRPSKRFDSVEEFLKAYDATLTRDVSARPGFARWMIVALTTAALTVMVLAVLGVWAWPLPLWQAERDSAARERLPEVERALEGIAADGETERVGKEKAQAELARARTDLTAAQTALNGEKTAKEKALADVGLAKTAKDDAITSSGKAEAELAQARKDLTAVQGTRGKALAEPGSLKTAGDALPKMPVAPNKPAWVPSWADAFGEDPGMANGQRWATLKVGTAQQRLRWIQPGNFTMGSPAEEVGRYGSEQQHPVELTRGFWIGDTELTQGLYQALMTTNPSTGKGPDYPVTDVSWDDCQDFLKALNARVPGLGARLPTETEWEYACRAGTVSAFNDGSACTALSGSDPALSRLGWYNQNSGNNLHPVAQRMANAWLLFDMHGNVWEWCADYCDVYTRSSETQKDPLGPSKGERRVLRGGSFFSGAWYGRSACRAGDEPGNRINDRGFRLAASQP